MCCPKNNEHACGWPPHTVRAVMAISVVWIAMVTQGTLAIWLVSEKEYTNALSLVAMLSTEVASIIGWYFGTHDKPKERDPELGDLWPQPTQSL